MPKWSQKNKARDISTFSLHTPFKYSTNQFHLKTFKMEQTFHKNRWSIQLQLKTLSFVYPFYSRIVDIYSCLKSFITEKNKQNQNSLVEKKLL